MKPVYVVLRGATVLSVHDTYHEARAAAQGPNTRIEARRGVRPWWQRPADWSVLA